MLASQRKVEVRFIKDENNWNNYEVRRGSLVYRTRPQRGYFLEGTEIKIPLNFINTIDSSRIHPLIIIDAYKSLMYQRGILD